MNCTLLYSTYRFQDSIVIEGHDCERSIDLDIEHESGCFTISEVYQESLMFKQVKLKDIDLSKLKLELALEAIKKAREILNP